MRSLWRTFGITKQIKAEPIDLFHGLSGELPIGIKHTNTAAVVTIHDLIFLRHPEFYQPIDVFFYKRKFYKTLREATRIIAISECTKCDILYYGDFPEDRIDLVYQSCGTRFSQPVPQDKLQEARMKYHTSYTH